MRYPRRLRPSPRLVAVLALQLVVVGLLAAGALGTGQDSPQVAQAPKLATLVAASADVSPPLDQATPVPNDPNRVIPEFERQTPATVAPSTPDAAAQTAVAGTPSVGSPVQSFAGISRTSIQSGYVPPDTVGDVGPTQYVEAVNGGIDVFSKTGDSLTGGITDSTFWSGLSGCSNINLSDPTVNYDQFADRWVYGELAYNGVSSGPFAECVAVSATGDATGSWYRYAFDIGGPSYPYLPDYPKLGVWPDGYYLSFNDFSTSTGTFAGAGAMVLERSAMLTGNATAHAQFFDLSGVSGLDGGMLPSDADGATLPPPGAPNYFVTPVDNSSNDQLGVWAFHVDWATPSNSSFTNVQALPVSAFNGYGYDVPQPGTSVKLDGLADDRVMNRLQYRNFGTYETLVTDETVDNGSSGDAPRWYELRRSGGSWSVNQQSTFQPDSLNRWMGSAAMNGSGDMALAYSAGDASTFAGLRYTGRQSGDALSTMSAEQTLVAGGGSQTGSTRWGDYSQLSVDPTDDCTFWYVGEYYPSTSSTDWSTRIGSFKVNSCSSSGVTYTAVPVVSGTLREGQALATTAGTWTAVPTATAYQWERCDSSGITCADITNATTNTYLLTASDAGKRLRVRVTVTTASGTGSIVSAATGTILPAAPVNTAAPTITGTTQVSLALVASTGTWTSSLAPTYTFQWQRCVTGTCSDIAGATGQSYVLTAGDVGATLRVGVTASTTGGSVGPVYSSQTAVVVYPPPPVVVVQPTITGSAQQGQTLTANAGSWSGVSPISYAYQWLRCDGSGNNCSSISAQTSVTYGVTSSDVGSTLRLSVTASNAGGATQQNSVSTSVVLPLAPSNTAVPTLSGSSVIGSTLAVSNGTWSGATPISYAYQWQRCSGTTCVDVFGATSASYNVTVADVGTSLRGVVTATNTGGSTSVPSSSQSVQLPGAPTNTGLPVVSGSATIGSTLTTSDGTWSGVGPITVAYQWQSCIGTSCSIIIGATANHYVVRSQDAGASIRVIVTAANAGGSTPATSGSTAVVAAAPASGGGGGGGSTPDLAVTAFATPATPLPGDSVTFAVTVTDKNLASATKLLLTVSLPTGITYVSGTADRGSGCTSTSATQVVCNLDYLSSDSPVAHVVIYGKVGASGAQNVSFSAASDLGDLNTADNTVTVPLTAAVTTTGGSPTGLNGGGTTTVTKTDKKAPTVSALASVGPRGGAAQLRFKVYDDSGVAQVSAVVKRNGTQVGTAKTGFGPVAYGSVYFVGWHVPRAAAKGRYTFCVEAADRSSNHSSHSCAPLTLR